MFVFLRLYIQVVIGYCILGKHIFLCIMIWQQLHGVSRANVHINKIDFILVVK